MIACDTLRHIIYEVRRLQFHDAAVRDMLITLDAMAYIAACCIFMARQMPFSDNTSLR